jgi:hypothetical protein
MQAASLMLAVLATYFFLSVLGSGCGNNGFFASRVTPTGSVTPTGTATATPGALSGDVLIVGGMNNLNQVVGVAELYNPNTGAFQTTGSLQTARAFHTATTLQNGLILIAGGQTASGAALNTAELYNESTQKFKATTGTMNTARALASATLLNDGTVLIAGGVDSNGNPLSAAEIFNSSTGTFTNIAAMNFPRAGHTATLLNDGTVLIVGGYSNSAQTSIVQPAEIYNPATKAFTVGANMLIPRFYHTATIFPAGSLLAGEVLIAGGQIGGVGPTASSEVYNPATTSFLAGATMHSTHAQATATLLQTGLVLIAGGVTIAGPTAVAELYNPGGLFAATGPMTTPRQLQTATIFPSGVDAGQVLVVGGESGNTPATALASAEIYNPVTSVFTTTSSMANARFGHTASLLP